MSASDDVTYLGGVDYTPVSAADDNGSATWETTPEPPSVSFTTSAMTVISTYGAYVACHVIIIAASLLCIARPNTDKADTDSLYIFSLVLSTASQYLLNIMAAHDYGTPPLSRSYPWLLLLLKVLTLVALVVAGMTNWPHNHIFAFAYAFPDQLGSLYGIIYVKWYRDE